MATQPPVSAPDEAGFSSQLLQSVNRRSFLRYSGMTAAAVGLVLAGCDDDDNGSSMPNSVNLGTGNVGILNYAYALEQLEAAFYAQVVSNSAFATTFTDAAERTALQAIARHEAIHRDFFKAAINRDAPGNIIADLTPNFSNINFTSRTNVLETARIFEDLGVAAYNGAGRLIDTTTAAGKTYLGLAGKIVSVEARHAAQIRDIISLGTFSNDVVNALGLDRALTPTEVLATAQPFIRETINGSNLPS
ncbi:ferritin-like domain-containing protein [Hymenobacter jeollabukensis]|uniref:Ferritin-like domain-containing protein n=1 Tax=Hymenobacter jeollabukensis TaxID=2025313 RepID=A0A5R8WMT7_9BACT|nr:ferritin-like domain-containing protein [Hymenobacter jeollabukensis]TLM90624.1 ferritin-like domain-containing protein [Hymenobacter jeollabukensis]